MHSILATKSIVTSAKRNTKKHWTKPHLLEKFHWWTQECLLSSSPWRPPTGNLSDGANPATELQFNLISHCTSFLSHFQRNRSPSCQLSPQIRNRAFLLSPLNAIKLPFPSSKNKEWIKRYSEISTREYSRQETILTPGKGSQRMGNRVGSSLHRYYTKKAQMIGIGPTVRGREHRFQAAINETCCFPMQWIMLLVWVPARCEGKKLDLGEMEASDLARSWGWQIPRRNGRTPWERPFCVEMVLWLL